jgi:Molybdopterin-binding domain of aldehyde dehydrogenase
VASTSWNLLVESQGVIMIEAKDNVGAQDIAAHPLRAAFVRAPRAGLRLGSAAIDRGIGSGRVRVMASMPDGSVQEMMRQAPLRPLESKYSGHILGVVLASSDEEADSTARHLHTEWELPLTVQLANFFSEDEGGQSGGMINSVAQFRSESDDELFDTADHTLRGGANIDHVNETQRILVQHSLGEIRTTVESAADPLLDSFDVFASLAEERALLQSVASQLQVDVEWRCGPARPSCARGREQTWILEVAFDWDGRIAALRGSCLLDVGDLSVDHTSMAWSAELLSGPYGFPVTNVAFRMVRSNRRPNPPTALQIRRGAVLGRERMLDAVACHLGLSSYVVRNRNLKQDLRDSALWRSTFELQECAQRSDGGGLAERKGNAVACDGTDGFLAVMQCKLNVDRNTGRFAELEPQCLWQSTGGLGSDSGEAHVAPDETQSVLLAPSVLGAVDDALSPIAPHVTRWPLTSNDLLASIEKAAHARYRILWKDCC